MVDLAAQDDACANIGADVDQDECFLCLRGTAIALALRRQVGIVLNNDQAVYDLIQIFAQRNGTPVFQGADRQHDAFIHVRNGRHSHDEREQLFPLLPGACAAGAALLRRRSHKWRPGLFLRPASDISWVSKLTPVQVHQQE